MDRDLTEFQVRIFRQDGKVSAYFVVPAWDVAGLTRHVEPWLTPTLPKAEIILDDGLLITLYAEDMPWKPRR